jgi:hypothetical protein
VTSEDVSLEIKNATLLKADVSVVDTLTRVNLYGEFTTSPFYSTVSENIDGKTYFLRPSGPGRRSDPPIHFDNGVISSTEWIHSTQNHPYLDLLMSKRLASIGKNEGLPVTIPLQRVVLGNNEQNRIGDYYCVVQEIPDRIPTVEETLNNIANLSSEQQKAFAKKLCRLIERSGFVEASFSNIRVTPAGGIVFFDTPSSLFLLEQDRAYNTRPSVEKCGSLGLHTLIESVTDSRLIDFKNQVIQHHTLANKSRISITLLLLSIFTLFIFALIQLIRAYIAAKLAQSAFTGWREIDKAFERIEYTQSTSYESKQENLSTYLRESAAAKKRFLDSIEGVPYSQENQFESSTIDKGESDLAPNFFPDPVLADAIIDPEDA